MSFKTPTTVEETEDNHRDYQPSPKKFEIIDVTESIARDCREHGHVIDTSHGQDLKRLSPDWAGGHVASSPSLPSDQELRALDRSSSLAGRSPQTSLSTASPSNKIEFRTWRDNTPTSQQADAASNLLYLSQTNLQPSTFLASRAANTPPSVPGPTSPDCDDAPIHLDDALVSGTSYHQLHSTLRRHLFQESRSSAPTRACTPEENDGLLNDLSDEPRPLPASTGELYSDERFILSEEQEFQLWRNWIEEVSPWVSLPDEATKLQNSN